MPTMTEGTLSGDRGISIGTLARKTKKREIAYDRSHDQTVGPYQSAKARVVCREVNVYYGNKQAISNVNIDIGENEVVAMIGPSGCGKSTFLRCLNRMNDTIPDCRVTGQILLDKQDVYDSRMDVVPLRAQVGMVFQKPNPFPKSIYDNVAYGPRIHGLAHNQQELEEIVVNALTKAGLWDEVKDRLHEPGTSLWGGQQQRLCIARTIAVSPDIILMDEPCSALDPIATAKIEQLIDELRENYSITIVTHSMQQAGDEAVNIADKTLHLCSFEELPPNRELILEIGKIAEQAVDMMRAALKAYDLLDEVPAEDVIMKHRALELKFQSELRRLVSLEVHDSSIVSQLVDIALIAKSLEAIGRHAKTIAEHVIFYIRGEDVRHSNA